MSDSSREAYKSDNGADCVTKHLFQQLKGYIHTTSVSDYRALVQRLRSIRLDSHYLSTIASLCHRLSAISQPCLEYLSIRNASKLSSNCIFTAVAESIVKGENTLRLVRHATVATLRRGNTVGLVRRIAQIEVGRPDIALCHAQTSAMELLESLSSRQPERLDLPETLCSITPLPPLSQSVTL